MIRFTATLQRADEPVPVRKAVKVEAGDIDVAAAKAVEATLDSGLWFVVALRQDDAIEGRDVL